VEIGKLFLLDDRLVRIEASVSGGQIRVVDEATGAERIVPPGALSVRPVEQVQAADFAASVALTEEQQRESLRRLEIIKPLLEKSARTQLAVTQVVRSAAVSVSTLYRWLNFYTEGGIQALAPDSPGAPKGSARLDPRVEQITAECIKRQLREGRSSVVALEVEVRAACDRLNADHPRTRPMRYPGEATLQRRLSKAKAQYENHRGETRRVLRERKQPMVGSLETQEALEIVQIDHTVLDVHAVDHETLEPIGRPTPTVGIDVYTRCVLGFSLQLLPPGTLPAALCIQHICYPKEPWLKRIGLDLPWPMFGVPQYIHTDNAREFKSHGFRYGCAHIDAEAIRRPLAKPRYGGTIERLIGTLMRKIHAIPGASYNDMLRKATKNPIRDARFTLEALEWEVAREIGMYHDTRHGALGITPATMWERALAQSGRLSPPLPVLPRELFILDFLPLVRKRVTKDGITLEGRRYWAEELRPFVNADIALNARPDLRNVRILWVLLPDGTYVRTEIYKPNAFRGITLWDWRTWCAGRSGSRVLNHIVHDKLLHESREKRAQAEARVKAQRKQAKTPIQSRKAMAQNAMFRRVALAEQLGGPQSERLSAGHRILGTSDLSKLPATAPSVFRKGPR
jgi:putative transposase